jgi:[histone H3]-lysine4 N-trimethyltransferase ATXR3
LGRILRVVAPDPESDENVFDVEWVLGGRLTGCVRSDLSWTCAEIEGMTCSSNNRRDKRKPINFMEETLDKDLAKKQRKETIKAQRSEADGDATTLVKKQKSANGKKSVPKQKQDAKRKNGGNGVSKAATAKPKSVPKRSSVATSTTTAAKNNKKQKMEEQVPEPTERVDLYEKHRREFERCFARLEEKIDCFRHFADEAPEQFVERYPAKSEQSTVEAGNSSQVDASGAVSSNPLVSGDDAVRDGTLVQLSYPSHAPFNWEMIRRRMHNGRYVIDRRKEAEDERLELLGPYFQSLGRKRNRRNKNDSLRILYPKGVDWRLFQSDVFAMCEAALARQSPDERAEDDGQRGTLSYTVKKLREALQPTVERASIRHASELAYADDRHKFALAVKASNTEAAMQSWRKVPFPERKYERIRSDVVCAGLSHLDEKIAAFELKTSLPDSFVGQSYRYDDTGQSEAWMKSVVDETGSSNLRNKRSSSSQKAHDERVAALALAADDGVTRAQVTATMQSLLIEVQDKVMTEANVLRQPELRSANWIADGDVRDTVAGAEVNINDPDKSLPICEAQRADAPMPGVLPEIVEQPVWGIDCYTRRNILNCLELEFDPRTSLLFVEKWLLPAINACPEGLAHNISNAARILEGLPFEVSSGTVEDGEQPGIAPNSLSHDTANESLLLRSLVEKIQSSGPLWLRAAANQLRRARAALGPDFFRVHPKGHGSVVLSPSLKANALVTFYHGELYPSWRWGEKMDAIEITQKRKDLKP